MIALRLALRDLRGGLAGLRLLALCLVLGVAALAGVGSLSSTVLAGLSEQGQAILGGDVQVEIAQRSATPEELAAFRAEGEVSTLVRMRAMALNPANGERLLVELKGVDDVYPLYGTLRMRDGALAGRPGTGEVAVAPELADRLGLALGGNLRIGDAEFRVIGLIEAEPDRVSQGFALGPTAMVSEQGLAATGLVQPGSLTVSAYRIRLAPGAPPGPVTERLQQAFPSAGLKVEDRLDGAPGTRRFLERIAQFLTLVGLSALAVAGIGVGGGVSFYLDGKSTSIAALKMLGAGSGIVFRTYLFAIAFVALMAIMLGGAIGACVPWIAVWWAGDQLPVPPSLALYPGPLLIAAAFGLLVALAFALPPLSRAARQPAAGLLRQRVERPGRSGWGARLLSAGAAVGVIALALATAPQPLLAAGFVGAVAGLLLLLGLVAWLVRRIFASLPHPRRPLLRLALANLHRPGAGTGGLIVALGLGFTLFTALGVIESNLSGQIRTSISERAPAYVLIDIPADAAAEVTALAQATAPEARLELVPSLRGTVTAIGSRRVAEMSEIPEGAWFLRTDRNLSFSATPPPGSRIVEGEWWAPDHRGPPLVSIDVENARAAGLSVGDTITVSVLGREIEARIANLREVDWSRLGLNFALVFSPRTFDGAPYAQVATVHLDPAHERAFARALAERFPSVSAVRVADVIDSVAAMIGQIAAAVRAASAAAILAGLAVLVGALAASRRARAYDSALMKLLGATRGGILLGQAIEFALLGLILCAVALALGSLAGWYVVVQLFELRWAPDWPAVLLTLGAGAGATLAIGIATTLPALAARPARTLRAL